MTIRFFEVSFNAWRSSGGGVDDMGMAIFTTSCNKSAIQRMGYSPDLVFIGIDIGIYVIAVSIKLIEFLITSTAAI